jgi:pimeloyl-ACP methyl ester carboxylesterase
MRGMKWAMVWGALTLSSCVAADPVEDPVEDVDAVVETPATPTVVELTTRDGVALVADHYEGEADRPGVVLLHMIPPQWTRTSWPTTFIDGLREKGWSVVVLDRRGAGDSEGVAEEAYTGENGRYDVEAAAKLLAGSSTLAVIGASNGTTSTLDYAVWAASEALPVPVALVMMTGGGYTEAQTQMEAVAGVPTLLTYSTEERAWSADQEDGAWVHEEFEGGAHGTQMFEAKPKVSEKIVDFLAEHLQ